jgi:hypothetical protein
LEIKFESSRNSSKKLTRKIENDLSAQGRVKLAEFEIFGSVFYGLIYFSRARYFVVENHAHSLSELEFAIEEGIFFNKVTYKIDGQQFKLRYFSFWNDLHADPMDPCGNDLFKCVYREWQKLHSKDASNENG